MIIIAHRLSTIVNCNRILLFSDGKILEEGTHEVLLKKQGAYYELMQKQINF
jgi:ABC-type multidrug transport system fused ATPase/permease subunit